ncbi:MAG: uroporphyrinogen decarboxylase family protein [Lachnospiraceae bacterium]
MRKIGKVKKYYADEMTPVERKRAIDAGKDYDRLPCIPFMGEFKCFLTGVSIWDFWHDPKKMIEAEVAAFNRYGYDRIVIGPNTRGITESLGGKFIYSENGIPYIESPFLKDYDQLQLMEPVDAGTHPRLQTFARAAEILCDVADSIVPIEVSIGGPFTIASNLRGVEYLLRDCRKCSEEIHQLMRIITDTQKSCIDMAANFGTGIAMADPVANPALIGPKMYEKFVYSYTKELTDYAAEKTGKKVSLHMCGSTYSIWKYLSQYKLNEFSVDNVVDLERAVQELGGIIPIAGNVDPVDIVMNGSKEDIFRAVEYCANIGKKAKKGYHLATGCDIPERTKPEQVDWFMEAARKYL